MPASGGKGFTGMRDRGFGMAATPTLGPRRRRRYTEGGVLMVAAILLGVVAIGRLLAADALIAVWILTFVLGFAGLAVVRSVRTPEPGEFRKGPGAKNR